MPELSEACMHHTCRLVCGFKHRGKNQKDPIVIALRFVIVNVFCTLCFAHRLFHQGACSRLVEIQGKAIHQGFGPRSKLRPLPTFAPMSFVPAVSSSFDTTALATRSMFARSHKLITVAVGVCATYGAPQNV